MIVRVKYINFAMIDFFFIKYITANKFIYLYY